MGHPSRIKTSVFVILDSQLHAMRNLVLICSKLLYIRCINKSLYPSKYSPNHTSSIAQKRQLALVGWLKASTQNKDLARGRLRSNDRLLNLLLKLCYSHVFILSYLVNKLQSRGILVEVLHGYLSFVMVYAVSIIAYTVGEIASRALPPIFTKKKEPHTLLPVVTRCIRVIQ